MRLVVAGGRSRGGFAGSDDRLVWGDRFGIRKEEVGWIIWIGLEAEHCGGVAIGNREKGRRVERGVHMVISKKKLRERRGGGQKVVPMEVLVVVVVVLHNQESATEQREEKREGSDGRGQAESERG